MPIYTMHNLWIPQGVCDKLDSCIKQFIWGGPHCHWVKWSTVSTPMSKGGLGLRRSRELNTVMLGKHVWEIIHNPEKPWVRLLTTKYSRSGNIFEDSQYTGASYTWRSIMQAASILQPGFITRVGRGDISLWYEKWLHKGKISGRLPFVDIHDIDLKIKDVFINNSWQFNLLYTQIPDDIKREMQSLFLNPDSKDLQIWEPSPSGVYSAKNAYSWLIAESTFSGSSLHTNNVNWKWIWKLKLPENIKHFVWLVMHNSLPTNSFRHSRHITNDKSCHRCGNDNEHILHTLRDCPRAKQVWNSFRFHSLPAFTISDISTWFYINAISEYGSLFIVIGWMLWRARNEEVFADTKWEHWKLMSMIHSLLDSIKKAFDQEGSPKQPRMVSWQPPSESYVKLNVDGSSFGNPGRSGFGGIIRNHLGQWLHGFSGSCGDTTNINAELQAIAQGLLLARQEGYNEVICESDSMVALTFIKNGVSHTHPYAPLVDYIRSLSNLDWQLSFSHSLREGNNCADWLAKYGSNMESGLLRWPQCPSALSPLLLADAMGIASIRE